MHTNFDLSLTFFHAVSFLSLTCFLYYRCLLIVDVQVLGIRMSQDEMHSLLNEIDSNYNGQMELQDYLQVNQETHLMYIFYSS